MPVLRFKDIIDSKCGIRYAVEELELASGFSRKVLLESPMMISPDVIESAYIKVQEAVRILDSASVYNGLVSCLCELRDISTTLMRLGCGEILDEIELFEIKHLSLLSEKVSNLISPLDIFRNDAGDEFSETVIRDVSPLLSLLDPDGLRISSFYIYDSYSEELASARKRLRSCEGDRAELETAVADEELKVRTVLSARARMYVNTLKDNLLALARIDIVVAKAKQMEDKGYVIPKILPRGSQTSYEGLFHPQIAEYLSREGKAFQPVDITCAIGPTLLVGVNMGGKSVVLKMLAFSQYLVQFGFAVPATSARVSPKDCVFYVSGDAESSDKGLSSFAGEIKSIDSVISAARSGRDILALIDEPARTTNPREGTALVSSLVTILSEMNVTTVITTHYDTPETKCRMLRVKGYVNGKMDYSLIDAEQGDVPHEAIDTARRLGADSRWLDLAQRLVDNR